MNAIVHASLARIAALEHYLVQPLAREHWAEGDYVVGEVTRPPSPAVGIERCDGRMIQVDQGDQVLGAFGVRFATLEATGSWEGIGPDGAMTALTGAGLFGKLVSKSPLLPTPLELRYLGHVLVGGDKARMRDYALTDTGQRFETPVLLVVGSSMSAGKTRSACIIIRRLRAMGLRVLAAKLTGAGRYRDVLSMGDAGAAPLFDFVDAGLPSTVCDPRRYREAAVALLSHMEAARADVAVVEAGASPLEPYNGEVATELLAPHVRMMLLCSGDPYAVVGMMQAFGRRPDLVAGLACNTDAGQALVEKLTGIPSLRLPDPATWPALEAMLAERFGPRPAGAAP